MANKYSKLSIDRKRIPEWIKLWCEENMTDAFEISETEVSNRIQYAISSAGKVIKLDFQKCSGGLLTICPKVGTNIPMSMLLAESIYERVSDVLKDSPFSNGFSIILSEGDFATVIDLLSELDGVMLNSFVEQNEDGKAKYKLYRFIGCAGDSVVIKYYPKTLRMQVQGKPLFLFNEIVAMVSENGANQDDVVEAHLKYCSIDMKKEEVYEELENVLGDDLYKFLSKAHKVILSTSFILSKIDGYLGDYSVLIQPASRAFEGFIKKVYAQEGLECDGEQQLGKFFDWPDHISPVMKEEYAQDLDDKIVKGFTAMYKFYTQYRHPYMHSTAYDHNTAVIESRKVADEKLSEIVSAMKSWYEWYFSK